MFKFQLANLSLEQLWIMSENNVKVEEYMYEIIRNCIISLDLTNSKIFLQSRTFEQYVFLGRSCLEFYMLYLVHLLRLEQKGNMTIDKFYKALLRAETDSSSGKATCVKDYFETKIFSSDREIDIISPSNWGTILKLIRDKIAHRDRIGTTNADRENAINDIFSHFPTLRDLTYDRFCQAMENGMWFMIHDLFPVLYDMEWQAGPYREGMFET